MEFWAGSQPWLKVRALLQQGRPYDFQCHAMTNQLGGFAFQIFDSNYWADVNKFHTTICSRVVASPGY